MRAWRANQKALEKALLERVSVSQAETNAFLNAQNKVTGFVKQYMDAADWFLDSPVPADVRAQVDGVLKQAYGELGEELKDALNSWSAPTLDLEHTMLVENIRAFAGAVSAVTDEVMPYLEVMAAITHAATRIGIGFVPFVGPTLDLCEAVTGKEYCMPNGKQLGTGERIFSAIGFGLPKIVDAYKGMAKAPISAGGKTVAEGVVALGDELGPLLRSRQVTKWKTLSLERATIDALTKFTNEFERRAAIHLMKHQGHKMLAPGDDVVRKWLGILPSQSQKGLSVACDFITVNPATDMIILSEAKEVTSAVGQVPVPKALEQINNVMKRLKELHLEDEVEAVQIITSKNKPLKGGYSPKNGTLWKDDVQVTVTGRTDLHVKLVEL